MSLAKSTLSEDENETPAQMEMESADLRRTSYASTDSRMSAEGSSRLGRRFSSLANQVIQSERSRRASRVLYQSPYSKLKTMPENIGIKETPKAPIIPLENTYRMEPKTHFPVEEIRQIIIKTLQKGIGNEEYDKVINPGRVCKTLSQIIKDEVKTLGVERFRVICTVTIGTKSGEGVRIASRCLWDAQSDRYASATVENGTLFSVGTVYGVYFE